jgi:hypothetical protein
MNWNEKLLGQWLSPLLIAAVTIVVTTLLTQKETTVEKNFSTFIVADNRSHLPPPIPPNQNNILQNRLSGYFQLANPKIRTQDGTETVYFDIPTDFNSETTFYAELLQYRLFKEIIEMHQERTGISQRFIGQGISEVTSSISMPFKVTDYTKISLNNYLTTLAENRFSKTPQEQHYLSHLFTRLPKGTEVFFQNIPASEATGSQKHKIILKKRFFFTVEITIESFGASGLGGLPAGIDITPEERRNYKTFVFPITLKVKFEQLTAGNWRTEEYKGWVDWMFKNLEKQFSDSQSPPV